MSRYHQDEETRVSGERHAGIVIKDKKILLIHRIKEGYEYYVFPGGHRRLDETGSQTVIREAAEETGIKVNDPELAFEFKDYRTRNTDYYYFCEGNQGDQPHLSGEEKDADPKVDYYDPLWINLEKIEELNILPKYAKWWLIEFLKNK